MSHFVENRPKSFFRLFFLETRIWYFVENSFFRHSTYNGPTSFFVKNEHMSLFIKNRLRSFFIETCI